MTAAAEVPAAPVPGYLGRVLDGGGNPVGTCFQVAPGVLVTAWHVLNVIGAAADGARVRIDPLAGGEAFDAAVKRLDQAHDLGVLVAERHLSAMAGELTATDQMAPRTAVTVMGYSVITDSGRIARSLTTIGRWTGPATWEDAPPAGRMTAEALMPGMSGAPVIRDSDGAVAGVVSGRYNSADGWLAGTVWVVRTEDLAALLNGIVEVTMRPTAAQALPGWPLEEVRDPFALEVHRPVQPEDPQPGLPELPAYVPRGHDAELGQVMRAAAGGRSGIAVLVGGSSTGKTRACWEALGLLRAQDPPWRLWHPIDPSRPEAALRELSAIGRRTVVWLNEAQLYLDVTEGGLGERVAAGLRELLRDPARRPVLVLATVWPQFWDGLTARPTGGADRHAQARELLAGHDITVPAAFTAAQLQQLDQAGDARLAQAAVAAQDGQVIQFLAGAPELLARYRNAPAAAKALIHAAMDARRLGAGIALPRAFMEAAAPGYLTDTEWDAQDDDWLEQALDYAAKLAKGVRGPLTCIRPGLARPGTASSGSRDSDEQLAVGQASTTGVPLYRLADYLDQHGRTHRKGEIPPDGFWAAAANHAFPADQAALGNAAHIRGLYRYAAQLHKNAAERGNLKAVFYLTNPPGHPLPTYLHNDVRPVHWAVAHAPLDDPYGVASLLRDLGRAGAGKQAAALLRRDPAAHVSLDDPGGVASLLDGLGRAGAGKQAAALLRRDPAAHVSLDDPGGVARLLDSLREAGAGKQAAALAARAAAQVPLDDPGGVARLLDSLREAGAGKQAAALAARAAAQVPLDDPGGVARLLDSLREAGADEQAAALAARDPATHAALDRLLALADLNMRSGVALLLDSLREAGADEQAAALIRRVPLDDLRSVAVLLDDLRRAGADEQAAALAARAAAQVPLDDPGSVARLLDELWDAGEQAAALAVRAAAQVPLDDPGGVADLLDSLREAGAGEQAALLARDPAAHAALDDPISVARLLRGLREAGAGKQAAALAARAAAQVPLDNPGGVARLLYSLRMVDADEQAAALLARDPAAHVSLDNPGGVADLLYSLGMVNAGEQAAALAARAAAQVPLDDPGGVARLLDELWEAGGDEQAAALAARAAAQVPLDDPGGVARLLRGLRKAGAGEQAAALAARTPEAEKFALFRKQMDRQDQFRFGREADGSPARPWDWGNLD